MVASVRSAYLSYLSYASYLSYPSYLPLPVVYSNNVIAKRWVLLVLGVWLALPAARLACAVSCAPATELGATPAASHCHEAPADSSTNTTVKAEHVCGDLGKLAVTPGPLKNRHTAAAPILSRWSAHADIVLALTTGDARASLPIQLPPDHPIVPLRL